VICALGASAMQALVRREVGWEVVRDLLAEPDNVCFAHAVNLCEVFYDFHRSADEATAQSVIHDLLNLGVVARVDMDPDFWKQAGRHKSGFRRVSLADCFCLTLAQRVGGELVTCDHHEFDTIAPLGLCRVVFIRSEPSHLVLRSGVHPLRRPCRGTLPRPARSTSPVSAGRPRHRDTWCAPRNAHTTGLTVT
jgi:PIN domain nuclease of toxin-antitoxin system